ncbi:unnamed protein product [Paramecium primaurelia]|uniref:F-box domain-containing protein n=1 Tax=Paramecium primaurelia TaxID=5886 RepID=A0A8S1P1Y8_PARPR|nr:unnamed protein product [Paramecium primaurelia]CAD8097025.1 unnamed protein product [Paramecium primaurelia]
MIQNDKEMPQTKGLFILRPEVLGKVFEFVEYNQLLQFRTLSKKADQMTQAILTNRLDKIKKKIQEFEGQMDPIKTYVYGELNGELNNDFMTTRMNIINAVNKMDFKSTQFKDVFEKDPVGIQISKYLVLLFKDNYETLWRLKVESISEEQFAELHKILELEPQIKSSPPLCKEMYQVYLDIIKLRSMRFMNEWHRCYKIDVECDKWIEKQNKIESILARIRQTEIEKRFK